MKTIRTHRKTISLILICCFLFVSFDYKEDVISKPDPANQNKVNTIKIALLLDTSSSMNGLIEQAKSQLWKIVNQLAMARKENENAKVEIALYQYGNSSLSRNDGYIQNILPLTSDLDELSEKLFALTTSGGNEYCGHAIKLATEQLNWSDANTGLNLIFIAGNEGFNQGSIHYSKSCANAINKGIIVNTIFCGDYQSGISGLWSNGASLTEGHYANLDMNQKTIYVETPYDQKISALNQSLNATYIPYGKTGRTKKSKQITQDNNSMVYGLSNSVDRTISKSSHLYDNSTWDLVDANLNKSVNIEKIDNSTLPKEMQAMNETEKLEYINRKTTERRNIQTQIKQLNLQRLAYIEAQNQEGNANALDIALLTALKKQAMDKGFSFESTEVTNVLGLNAAPVFEKAYVDFDFFEQTMQAARIHRESRLINFNTFMATAAEKSTLILDTRSKEMYDKMHIKRCNTPKFFRF